MYLESLVIDESCEVSLVTRELHQHKLVTILPRKGKQKLEQKTVNDLMINDFGIVPKIVHQFF